MFCGMVETCPVSGEQRECGRIASFRYKDGEHCICTTCHDALDDDIAEEYELISVLP